MSLPDPSSPECSSWVPVTTTDKAPPVRPPENLLAEATQRLAARHQVAEDHISWSFQTPQRRPHSYLLPVTAALGDRRKIAAWYKVVFVPRGADGEPDPSWVEQIRAGIVRGQRAAEALERGQPSGLNEPPLALPTILSAEPGGLRVLMTSVPGRPLGRILSASPRRLVALRRIFHRIGAAVRTIENLLDEPPPVGATGTEERVAAALNLALCSGGLQIEARADVEARLQRLGATLLDEGNSAWVHGDLSGSNVLVRCRSGIGLVDLDWRPRPRGFDLATYSVRLQLERPRIQRLTMACLEALFNGHSEGIASSAGFHLERSQRWLRLLGEGILDPSSIAGRRVVEELRGGRPWLPTRRFA